MQWKQNSANSIVRFVELERFISDIDNLSNWIFFFWQMICICLFSVLIFAIFMSKNHDIFHSWIPKQNVEHGAKWHCVHDGYFRVYSKGKERRNSIRIVYESTSWIGGAMIFLIDDKMQMENYFWNCLHSIASDQQIQRVLDGFPLLIGGTKYQIIFECKE